MPNPTPFHTTGISLFKEPAHDPESKDRDVTLAEFIFLWLCAKRSKLLPEGGNLGEVDFYAIKKRLRDAVRFAVDVQRMTRSVDARALTYRAC
jgi:hypothetical protein